LTSSFATFALPGTSLEPALDGRDPKAPPRPSRLLHLLAHEMFHRWNGEILRGAEPEALVYWFSEGFTDYYAARLLWIAGLYTLGDYLDEVNRTIRDYASNPKKGAPNAAIAEGFWKDRDVQRLPYQRGHLAALQWNAEARRRSGGKRSLDDAVLALCQGARARGDKIDVDKLLTLAAAEAGEDYARRLRAIVVDGADVELAPDTLEPFAKLEVADASPFDPCLDLGATRARGVVTGLRLGSEAERAGLAEGQAVQSLSIQDGDASAPARATIAVREGLTETLWYFPRAERRLVARFVPR
jgi:predicted metalloprotease with PDZ domain